MNRACPPCTHTCRQGRDCPALNPTERRFPRSLESAFGPHTSRHIEEPRSFDREDRIVMWACIAVAAIVLALGVL